MSSWDWSCETLKGPAAAIKTFEKGAEIGRDDCMYHLGLLYELGWHGKFKDHELALTWYRKAAQKGNSDAKSALKRLGAS